MSAVELVSLKMHSFFGTSPTAIVTAPLPCILSLCCAGSECWEAFNSTKPAKEKCKQCEEPFAVVEEKFSGNFVQLDDGAKVHGAFAQSFRYRNLMVKRRVECYSQRACKRCSGVIP